MTKNDHLANGGKAYSYQLDVTDKERVYSLAEEVKKSVGEVTMLVNNAGIVTGKHIMDCPDALMIKTMEVNTIAHFWVHKCFVSFFFFFLTRTPSYLCISDVRAIPKISSGFSIVSWYMH